MTARPVARGVLWGFLLALAVFALALVMGPGPASLWALLAAVLVLSQGIAVNVAVSLPAARGWPPPIQGMLRGWAFFTGPAFLAGGAVLALQAGPHLDWLAAGLAAALLGTTATVGALRMQRSAEPAPRWLALSRSVFAAAIMQLVVLGILLPKFRGVSGKAEDYPMREAIDSLSRLEEHAHDSLGRYLGQRELARRGHALTTATFTLAVESADSDGAYLTATSRTTPRQCGYVMGFVRESLPEWHGDVPHLFPRCWTISR